MKFNKIYIESLVLALAITLFVICCFWYYYIFNETRAEALQSIDNIKGQCDALEPIDTACPLKEDSYDMSIEILCGDEINGALSELEGKITSTYDRWEIEMLHRGEIEARMALNVEKNTLDEIEEGSGYFLRVYRGELGQLFDKGVLGKPCKVNDEKLKEYAECNVKNAEKLLPPIKRPISEEYYKKAQDSMLKKDYLAAITYITATVAFQDKVAREQYESYTLVENGPMCD